MGKTGHGRAQQKSAHTRVPVFTVGNEVSPMNFANGTRLSRRAYQQLLFEKTVLKRLRDAASGEQVITRASLDSRLAAVESWLALGSAGSRRMAKGREITCVRARQGCQLFSSLWRHLS